MEKVILCRDVGFDCKGVIRAESEEEAIAQAVDHARTVHGLTEISDEVAARVRAAVRDE
jgi:predicted small metal-binding protein